jgi:hypothetical protein
VAAVSLMHKDKMMQKKPSPITEQQLRARLADSVERNQDENGRGGMAVVARNLKVDLAALHRFLSGGPARPKLVSAMGLKPLKQAVLFVPK